MKLAINGQQLGSTHTLDQVLDVIQSFDVHAVEFWPHNLVGGATGMFVRAASPGPGLMMRPQTLGDGRQALVIANWTEVAQALTPSVDVVMQAVQGSTRLAAGEAWKIPPLSGALVIAE